MITNDEFKGALGRFASGVTVVTGVDKDGKFHGLTVSAFSSVSLEPRLILICVATTSHCCKVFADSKKFAVNILSESQESISNAFASKAADRFAGVSFETGDSGLPLLSGCVANIECTLERSHDAGDHVIFIGRISNVRLSDRLPLTYFRGAYRKLQQ